MALRIWESFRGVFYIPYYAAFARDAFAAEGVDAILGTVPPGADPGDALRSGDVDVIWGGPMRVMVDHDTNPDSDITCFCEVVARDPFTLIGAAPRPDFDLADLYSLRFATVTEVPTPWMCLQEDLRKAGHDPDQLARIKGLTMAETAEALRRGEVDVIQTFEPFVEQLLASGHGHVWLAAADRGRTSYTTFYALRHFLDTESTKAEAVTRAIYRTQIWLHAAGNDEIATVVGPYFPDLDHGTLAGAIGRYRANGVWGATPIMTQEAYERQAEGLISGRLIKARPPFGACVDMRFAERAVASLKDAAG